MSVNLPKLLRTLGQYEADLLIFPSGNSPRILVKNQWKIIEEQNEVSSDQLIFGLKEFLGGSILENLENGLEISHKYDGERYILSMQENQDGKIFLAQRLKPLWNDLTGHKAFVSIEKWLRANRGILTIHDQALYASILKYFSQHRADTAVSLERGIKYPAKSFMGLIEQKELGEHFTTLEDGLREALKIKANLIAINEIKINKNEQAVIEKIATEKLILILPDQLLS